MKTKLLILFPIIACLLTFTVAPAMAEPAQRIPVTARTSGQIDSSPEKVIITEGGVIQMQGVTRTGRVTLTIDGQTPLVGTEEEVMDFSINTNTLEIVAHSHKLVFTFTGGTFEGQKTSYETGVISIRQIPQTLEQHTVMHGTGTFDGQKLMLTEDWALATATGPPTYIGVLIIP
jgi:hypothetical protein